MLSIHPLKSSQSAAHYYQDKDNYYLADKTLLQQSTGWRGEGARKLGLNGQVDGKQFEALLSGLLPDGNQVGMMKDGEIKHRPGFDLTCSAPKSVSILALIGGDSRLLDAHQRANNDAIDAVEKQTAQARITRNGETTYEATKNLIIAQFSHTTSREIDPQLHTHNVVNNITQRQDGEWRALASSSYVSDLNQGTLEQIYRDQHYYGLRYTSRLAKDVKALGYGIRVVDQYGNFEIEGLDQRVIDCFSKRKTQIQSALEKKGLSGAKAAEIAALDSRKLKKAVERGELTKYWQDEIKGLGVDLTDIIDHSHAMLNQAEKTNRTITNDVTLCQKAIEAVDDAVQHLAQYNVSLRHGDLVRQALRFSSSELDHDHIEQAIGQRMKDKTLVGEPGQYYTTQTLMQQERDTVVQVTSGKKTSFSLDIARGGMASKVLRHQDRTHIVDVKGFRHETGLVQSLVNQTESNGLTAHVLHVGRSQTNLLHQKVKRPANTMMQWLRNTFKPELAQTVAGFCAHYPQQITQNRKARDCIIVHDAQKLSYEAMTTLDKLAEKTQAKLVLLNNTEASKGFSAGSVIKVLKQGGVQTHQSRTSSKMNAGVLVDIKASDQPMQALIDYYMQQPEAMRDKQQLVVHTNQRQKDMTQLIRAHRQTQGELGLQSVAFDVLSTRGLSQTQQKHTKFYRIGDRVTLDPFTKKQKHYRVIERQPKHVILEDASGNTQRLRVSDAPTLAVSQKNKIACSVGDKIRLDRDLWLNKARIERHRSLHVTHVDRAGMTVRSGNEHYKLDKKTLQSAYLSYDYMVKPHQLMHNHKTILTCLEGYQLNKNTLGELVDTSEQVMLFTGKHNKAQALLDRAQITWVASEVTEKQLPPVYREARFADESIRSDLEAVVHSLSQPLLSDAIGQNNIADTAVAYAMAKLGEREAAYEHVSLIKHALIYALGDVDTKAIESIVQAKKEAGELIHAGSYWTTKTALTLEKAILSDNQAGKKSVQPMLKTTEAMVLPDYLSTGQRNAILLGLSTQDRFVGVQGIAGSGKTTMMRLLQEQAVKAGYQIIGVAPTHVAVHKLDDAINPSLTRFDKAGIPAMTAHKFLGDDETTYTDKTLLIVDESSMLGNRVFNDIQKKVLKLGIRAMFAGDKGQNPAIDSGKPFELSMMEDAVTYVVMPEIQRQKDPQYQQAVHAAARKNIQASFAHLEKMNPEDHIQRQHDSMEHMGTSSVIQVSIYEKDKDGEVTKNLNNIYRAVANDYLTRIPEQRDHTFVVAHAHEDRHEIDALIRTGLKVQGVIAQDDIETARFIQKNMDQVDMLHVKNFQQGDVLSFAHSFGAAKAGDYWYVRSIVSKKNQLQCITQAGDTVLMNPAKLALKTQMTVLQYAPSDLSVGDRIRLRKTNLKRGWVANQSYTVSHIDGAMVTLNHPAQPLLVLDTREKQDQHWDYAYTNTSYGIQGEDDQLAIGLELAMRKQATTHQAHYVDITRAKQQVTIYTEDKNQLIRRLDDARAQKDAEKRSAYEETKAASDKIIEKERGQNETSQQREKRDQTTSSIQPKLDAKSIESALLTQTEALAMALLGKPNKKFSNNDILRYGKKGSLVINLESGLWYSHESDEGGNVFDLIQKEEGLSDFKAVLQYASDFVGHVPWPTKPSSTLLPKKDKASSDEKPSGMREYAKILHGVSKPLTGTLGECYLQKHRHLRQFAHADLRFLPYISTYHGDEKTSVPALLAFAKDHAGEVHHVQVIRLDPKTGNKDQHSNIQKQTYGSSRGYAIELNHQADKQSVTYLTEGIETGLSILESNKKAHVLAVLGKSNFANIKLDTLADEVVLCLDHDGVSTYTNDLVERAVHRLEASGKVVRLILPEADNLHYDGDFNDVLKEKGVDELSQQLNQYHTLDSLKALRETQQMTLAYVDRAKNQQNEKGKMPNEDTQLQEMIDTAQIESLAPQKIQKELER
jgi:conjugative transfer relaxase protein TraI